MLINNPTLFYYPFSGGIKQDLYEIIELFRELNKIDNELTIIMADTFEGDDYFSRLVKFIHEISFDQNQISEVKRASVEFPITPERISTYQELCKDYGWSNNVHFEMYYFKFRLKDYNQIELELIFTNMDAFNCFDYLMKNLNDHTILGEMNLILKNPGQGLNVEGLNVFTKLGSNFKHLNKVFVFEGNEMNTPEGYSNCQNINAYNCYQFEFFDATTSDAAKLLKRLRPFI